MKYIEPKVGVDKFTCPHCNAISKQDWGYSNFDGMKNTKKWEWDHEVRMGTCHACNRSSVWVYRKMVYPDAVSVDLPNEYMPEDVKKYYLEAASIKSKSPRGAAALLRLAIQILCIELGESGKNINNDIASLVKKGLPSMVQESLDIVRVTGNDAVHPGHIDTDDEEVVSSLFTLINVIVEYMIALPKQVSGMYDNLPKKSIDAINKRDNK